jgi:hypothetical protein
MRARPFGIDREHLPRIRDPLVQAPRLAGRERQTVEIISLRQTIHAGFSLRPAASFRHWFEAFIAGHTN